MYLRFPNIGELNSLKPLRERTGSNLSLLSRDTVLFQNRVDPIFHLRLHLVVKPIRSEQPPKLSYRFLRYVDRRKLLLLAAHRDVVSELLRKLLRIDLVGLVSVGT